MPINIQIVSAAEDILAQEAFGIGILERLLHDDQQVAILAADVDVSGMSTNRECGNHDAFNYGMRIVFENQPILASPRLALVPVAEHVFRLYRLLRDKRPFHPRTEPGPAPSAQAGVLHLIDDDVRLHGECLLHGFVAVQLEIAIDIRSALSKALRDNAYLVGMGN